MSTTETIAWYPTSVRMPDADATVLIEAPGCNAPVGLGWWDGAVWRSSDGWPLYETPVTHWAEMPNGPTTNPSGSLIDQVTPRHPRPCTDDIVATYTVTRTYRPTGRTLEMIRALRERGPMTSAQLADATGVPSKQVLSLLARPLEAGLVLRHASGDAINWSAA